MILLHYMLLECVKNSPPNNTVAFVEPSRRANSIKVGIEITDLHLMDGKNPNSEQVQRRHRETVL